MAQRKQSPLTNSSLLRRMQALVAGVAFGAIAVPLALAQDSGALVDVLVRKGILTSQEGEEVRAELLKEYAAQSPAPVVAGGKSTSRLSLGMRLQSQFADLGTDIDGGVSPAATEHFFLRRMYLTLKAGLGGNWGTTFTYDFASGGYDDAIISWKDTDLSFDFGLRKVNVAYEERATSGNIRAIERSSVTRYFVEPNNGRRLGAASYRIGIFADGRVPRGDDGFVYSAAVTSPERVENYTQASEAGTFANNSIAFWGSAGWSAKLKEGSLLTGVGAGFLPDQGGWSNTNLGKGYDLLLLSAYADLTYGRFSFMGEYLTADVENGASATADAKPFGYYLQPAFMLTENLELVVRYAFLDSDGRGVSLSDGIRSAPSGGTMDKLTEWFVGGNYYLRSNDLKFQLGYVYGRTEDKLTGGAAKATAQGVRSQVQVQF